MNKRQFFRMRLARCAKRIKPDPQLRPIYEMRNGVRWILIGGGLLY